MQNDHPIVAEYREAIRSRMPNALTLFVKFNIYGDPYAKELSEINKKFDTIENQLEGADHENQTLLRGQLMGLISQMEVFYFKIINTISEDELEDFVKRYGEIRRAPARSVPA